MAQWLLQLVAAQLFPGSSPGLRLFLKMRKIKPSKLKWKKTDYGYFRKVVMECENKKDKTCKVQFIRIPPNAFIKPHYHRGQKESEYVLAGSGTIKSGKKL